MILKATLWFGLAVALLHAASLENLVRHKREYTENANWLHTLREAVYVCEDMRTVQVHDEDAIKDILVNQHNQFRNLYNQEVDAAGCSERAADNLEWSQTLAKVAQLWANVCTMGHGFLEFKCDGNNVVYGQNTMFSQIEYDNAQSYMLEQAVSAWYNDEKPHTDVCTLECSYGTCTHFTQLVAKKYTKVGCAYTDPDHKCEKLLMQDDSVAELLDSQFDVMFGTNWPSSFAMYVCMYE